MFNFNNRKNRKIVSSIIVILLVLAMVAPMILSAMTYLTPDGSNVLRRIYEEMDMGSRI